jgi:aminomethyltransferase
MKTVALNDLHVSLRAKMIEFAGYNMPVLYTNLIQEHLAVRNSVGVFDVSHMGEFLLKGEKALDLIHNNNAIELKSLEGFKIFKEKKIEDSLRNILIN